MRHSRRARATAVTLTLVAGLGSLAACGDGGGMTTTSTGGKTEVTQPSPTGATSGATTGHGLPEDFPKDIPLVDETVANGVKGAEGGPFAWSVVMTSSRAVADLSKEVTGDFATAGYSTDRTNDLADVSIHQFSNASYDVGVTIARTGDGVTITYLVKNRS